LKQFAYLKALLAFAFRENPLLYLALLISALSVAIEVAAMVVLMPLANLASGGPIQGDVGAIGHLLSSLNLQVDARGLLLLFVALFSGRVLSQFLGQSLIFFLSRRLFAQMTTRAFHSLLSIVPIREVERKSIGSYITLAGDEAFRASGLITHLSQLVNQTLLAGLYFIAIWSFSQRVAIAVVLFLVVTLALMLEAFRASHHLGSRQVEQSQAAGSLFLDALNGLRTVRAYAAEQFVEASYRKQLRQYVWTLFSIDAISLLTRLGPALLLFMSAGVYVYLSPPVLGEAGDFATLIVMGLLLMRFFPVVGQTVSIGLKVISDARAGRDVTDLLDKHRASESAAPQTASPLPVDEITLEGACFAHTADKPVLDNVTFSLKRGKSYALIGRSGSGKSTLMDLLLRFYEPDAGSILVDGTDVKKIGERQLRRRILLVNQETTIFNDTVGNNVRFGLNATSHEVMRACQIACIDDLIAELPNGLDAMLTYRGTNLSGGQRQRIGLARALLRLPPVLLLDESTSALDAETRLRVVEHLKAEYRDKILVFVTHDANIIESVDEVLDLAELNRLERPQ
jgi:ABC-type bacteriocin/lantibiotic exporter with double-glycine peptidase domain